MVQPLHREFEEYARFAVEQAHDCPHLKISDILELEKYHSKLVNIREKGALHVVEDVVGIIRHNRAAKLPTSRLSK